MNPNNPMTHRATIIKRASLIGILALELLVGCHYSDDVYLCTGPQSHAYHTKSDCYGLLRCSGDIIEMPLDSALARGRHRCKFCGK